MVAGARCIALKVDTLSHQLGSLSNKNRCNLGSFVRSSRLSARAKLEQQQPNCNDKKLLEFEHLRVCQWQSSCAILNSHLVGGNEEVEKKSEANSTPGSETGLVTTTTSSISLLPRPLSIADLAPAPMHGSQLRVAYQGVPGAYSEAAASKAYPDCDAVPCDQFEAAFQAVELWVADRAVLPVENSLGGSIHRNYDLLLRHRLHIVGEVQLPVHHCLLALAGTRKEDLRRVISHPQALAQCEHTLTKLGLKVAREAFDDTALAAQVVAEQYLRDTAAIASARAADIYGLTVLADGIQARMTRAM
ncbi:arogenate dehydratase 1 isoform X2 [Cryptomeria japonica]|uniref:arogenate dehydratase 1 isoform X2 n=1 Tax=Cryptomeria japonica TaxID=3369 RepID=UPI0025ABF4DE|nr:arogenate dehydratase 1 isoform X2 [Cryptomeria japonica]